ncbi:hypothetical protein [Paenibacillus sp. J2TS4]|uniref:hypothetical protein n=1 Tax=Paenibacillus sp. J2TS4 TaxID=2807194 RepID=UPI001B19F356|nr:hypothetical protein [Paenibacillus sp. J2TS4]GIP33272.1 hypothetical protein J2TS4_24820 [Paenibacillus sp. J2TS4]
MAHEKSVYILLSDTGTLFTRLIRLYTKAPYNHASIAFDSELTEVYSFGRKRPNNPFIGGFIKENVRSSFFRNATCAVYCCKVDLAVYEKMRNQIRDIELNKCKYRYNLLGLFGILLKRRIHRTNAYFCSQFVAWLFEQSGASLVGKCPSMTTPCDLEKSEKVQLIYTGELYDYYLDNQGHSASINHPNTILPA